MAASQTVEHARADVFFAAQEAWVRACCVMVRVSLIDSIRDEGVSAAKPLVIRSGWEDADAH